MGLPPNLVHIQDYSAPVNHLYFALVMFYDFLLALSLATGGTTYFMGMTGDKAGIKRKVASLGNLRILGDQAPKAKVEKTYPSIIDGKK